MGCTPDQNAENTLMTIKASCTHANTIHAILQTQENHYFVPIISNIFMALLVPHDEKQSSLCLHEASQLLKKVHGSHINTHFIACTLALYLTKIAQDNEGAAYSYDISTFLTSTAFTIATSTIDKKNLVNSDNLSNDYLKQALEYIQNPNRQKKDLPQFTLNLTQYLHKAICSDEKTIPSLTTTPAIHLWHTLCYHLHTIFPFSQADSTFLNIAYLDSAQTNDLAAAQYVETLLSLAYFHATFIEGDTTKPLSPNKDASLHYWLSLYMPSDFVKGILKMSAPEVAVEFFTKMQQPKNLYWLQEIVTNNRRPCLLYNKLLPLLFQHGKDTPLLATEIAIHMLTRNVTTGIEFLDVKAFIEQFAHFLEANTHLISLDPDSSYYRCLFSLCSIPWIFPSSLQIYTGTCVGFEGTLDFESIVSQFKLLPALTKIEKYLNLSLEIIQEHVTTSCIKSVCQEIQNICDKDITRNIAFDKLEKLRIPIKNNLLELTYTLFRELQPIKKIEAYNAIKNIFGITIAGKSQKELIAIPVKIHEYKWRLSSKKKDEQLESSFCILSPQPRRAAILSFDINQND